jgi:pimeloyl-ACP methyl ester carboxylesterase
MQGEVTVPEDYTKPHGPTTTVFYYGRVRPNKPAVVFFNGGPFEPSHGAHEGFDSNSNAKAALEQLSMIYIDQRGTGCSQEVPAGSVETVAERLSHFGAAEIVMDAEVIRKKLFGSAKWKVFGQSFGGRVVMRYLINAPEGILSAHAHGLSIGESHVEEMSLRLLSQHRVLETYLTLFPDDRAILQNIKKMLKPKVCFKNPDPEESQEICGYEVILPLFLQLGFSNYWPQIHQLLSGVISGGEVTFESLSDLVKSLHTPAPNSKVSANSQFALIYSDHAEGRSSDPDINCAIPYRLLRERGEKPDEWLLTECMATEQLGSTKESKTANVGFFKEIFKIPQKPLILDHLKASLKANPQIEFYVYSGELDSFVPRESFVNQVRALDEISSFHYHNFLNSGHEGYNTEVKVWADILR